MSSKLLEPYAGGIKLAYSPPWIMEYMNIARKMSCCEDGLPK